MRNSTKQAARLSALGVAAAFAVSGVLTTPALAASTDLAALEGETYDAQAKALLADDAVVSVGQNGEGEIVIAHIEGLSAETQAFIEEHDNVVTEERTMRLQAWDQDEVVGGAGYAINRGGVCSVGFSAWTEAGEPAVISAGHCGVAGDTAERTVPSLDDAAGSDAATILDGLGVFSFSQYGGPGNTPGGENRDSIDIATIDVTNDALTLRPEITDWTTFASDDLAASTTPVTAVGTPAVGQQVSKSGRTTGFSSGTVNQVETWANVCEDVEVPSTCRSVFGFLTNVDGAPGDSGGSVFSGTTALGVVSGGGDGVLFASELANALTHLDGYSVMLDIAEPTVTTPPAGGIVAPGANITGTAPAGSVVEITIDDVTTEVTVSASGTWAFPAPTAEGAYTLSIVAVSGFNVSDVVTHEIVVEVPALTAPVITSPTDGAAAVAPVTAVTGTGVAGASVTLGGDAEGSATVGADGTWSIPVDFGIGSYTVTATQTRDDEESETVSVTFDVVPAAPAITSPASGSVTESDAPTAVSGTGIDGAEVVVTVNGVEVGSALVVDGEWTVALDGPLSAGEYVISAVQTVDGATSAASTVTVTVTADVVEAPPGGEGEGTLPATGLDTGSAVSGLVLGAGAIAAAGVLMLIARMRAKTAALQSAE